MQEWLCEEKCKTKHCCGYAKRHAHAQHFVHAHAQQNAQQIVPSFRACACATRLSRFRVLCMWLYVYIWMLVARLSRFQLSVVQTLMMCVHSEARI